MTYTWTDYADMAVGKVLGYDRINNLRNNYEALKERFSIEHTFATGVHTRAGAVAYGTIVDTTGTGIPALVSGTQFNIASLSYTGAAAYRVTFSTAITSPDGTVVASFGDSTGTARVRLITHHLSTTHVDLWLCDESALDQFLAANIPSISFAVFQP
jgi:hypothetical protein